MKSLILISALALYGWLAVSIGQAAPGDVWDSGKQFHSPLPGSPLVAEANPLEGNSWSYGFRMARGYNDGKWSHMDAGPFTPFRDTQEFGPTVFGAPESGADLNRWWVPFPAPEGQVCVGSVIFPEGAVEAGPTQFLSSQVHLMTDDDAPITGIVALRWTAPHDGVYRIAVRLENRLKVDEEVQRDPYYHVVANDVKLNEGFLEGFGAKAIFDYDGVTLSQGDTVDVCASTGDIAFPFALLAADVSIEELPASAAKALPSELATRKTEEEQGAEPVIASSPNHPYSASMTRMANWLETNLGPESIGLPISFTYDGKQMFRSPYNGHPLAAGHLRGWKTKRSWERLDDSRVRKTITYRDLKSDLQVRFESIEYHDFPTVEWVVTLKNLGEKDTPIIEQILGLNGRLEADRWTLRHSAGSFPGAASYSPFVTPLKKGRSLRLGAYSGRPSDTDMPYFNLDQDGDGLILAVGWPGQWETMFRRSAGRDLHIQSGQQLTHLRLRPGEEIRTPLIVLQFRARGDWIDGQNVWRRWMIRHNLPRPGGELVKPMFSGQTGYFMDWMYKATEENQKKYIDRFLELGLEIDHWWMDTGWYTPLWEPVAERFPNGIKPISDHAATKGIKTILWFEPERITGKGWVTDNHPSWVLNATTSTQGLLDLGHPEALSWITDHIHRVLKENRVGVFRSDFNMDPLDHWRQNDAPDRQGVTENHFVQGYLTFWDGLLEGDPDLLIDSCASGGRRNDLESMRRGVPLWKCDHAIEPVAMQCQIYGLSQWIPYFGNAGGIIDTYMFRSNMYPAITKGAWEDRTPTRDIRDGSLDYVLLRKLIAQWREVSPHYFGDFYPLTPFTLEKTGVWLAWQYNTPGEGGFVQAFRRPGEGTKARRRFLLRGLEPGIQYEVKNFDTAGSVRVSAGALMEKGLVVELTERPGAALIAYRKVGASGT